MSDAGKTFEQYRAEHTKAPFPLPMPGGETIPVPHATINSMGEALKAFADAREAGQPSRFAGLEASVGEEGAAKIAAAWGDMPLEAWDAMVEDMGKHFGQGNSEASPPS